MSPKPIRLVNLNDTASIRVFRIELVSRTFVEGKIITQNSDEVVILQSDNQILVIQRSTILSITDLSVAESNRKAVSIRDYNPSVYFFSPSGIPLKKKTGYYQMVYYGLYNNLQYGITNNISVGVHGSPVLIPIFANVKVSGRLYKSPLQNKNLYYVAGVHGGSLPVYKPPTRFLIPQVGLTFGNMENNVTVSGGLINYYDEDIVFKFNPINQQIEHFYVRRNRQRPQLTVGWNVNVQKSFSLIGEIFYAKKVIVGGTGIRMKGKKVNTDFWLMGTRFTVKGENCLIPVPFLTITFNVGSKYLPKL